MKGCLRERGVLERKGVIQIIKVKETENHCYIPLHFMLLSEMVSRDAEDRTGRDKFDSQTHDEMHHELSLKLCTFLNSPPCMTRGFISNFCLKRGFIREGA